MRGKWGGWRVARWGGLWGGGGCFLSGLWRLSRFFCSFKVLMLHGPAPAMPRSMRRNRGVERGGVNADVYF